MKKLLPSLFVFLAVNVFAQSPKTVLIEHFTNTKCSICASRNPGFYNTLASYPQVLHVAFHPSSPYPSCYFNQQNVTENDDRTKFYNIYGSTPKVAVNGFDLAPANPLITNAEIDAELNKVSPLEVITTEELVAPDSVMVKVVVKTTGATNITSLLLFAGVFQDTIQYSAGNGEQLHHDVFRKALTRVKGDTIQTPALNDSLVFDFTYKIKPGWREPNLNTVAWVQQVDIKYVLNAGKSHRVVSIPSGVGELTTERIEVFPNPANSTLFVRGQKPGALYSIYNLIGQRIDEQRLSNSEIDISSLLKGVYFLRINALTNKFVKQ